MVPLTSGPTKAVSPECECMSVPCAGPVERGRVAALPGRRLPDGRRLTRRAPGPVRSEASTSNKSHGSQVLTWSSQTRGCPCDAAPNEVRNVPSPREAPAHPLRSPPCPPAPPTPPRPGLSRLHSQPEVSSARARNLCSWKHRTYFLGSGVLHSI